MITCYLWMDKKLQKINLTEFGNISQLKKKKGHIWVSAKDPTPEEAKLIEDKLKLHPTTTEDLLSKLTRIKYEEFEENTLIVFKGIKSIKGSRITFYTVSIVDGDRTLVTVFNDSNSTIEGLMANPKRIESLLKRGEDYIVHHILDKEIDKYVDLKGFMSEDLKNLEDRFLKKPSKDVLKELFVQEKMTLEIKQRVDLMTDVCQRMMKMSDNHINKDLIPYFRDIYDHSSRVSDALKTYLDRINSLRETYISITSHRMNETIHILTIVTTIMMPLSVLTGFFGMNVRLPLQDHPMAYLMIFGLMIVMVYIMFDLFKKQGWLGLEGNGK